MVGLRCWGWNVGGMDGEVGVLGVKMVMWGCWRYGWWGWGVGG